MLQALSTTPTRTLYRTVLSLQPTPVPLRLRSPTTLLTSRHRETQTVGARTRRGRKAGKRPSRRAVLHSGAVGPRALWDKGNKKRRVGTPRGPYCLKTGCWSLELSCGMGLPLDGVQHGISPKDSEDASMRVLHSRTRKCASSDESTSTYAYSGVPWLCTRPCGEPLRVKAQHVVPKTPQGRAF